jgi:hypothetical protein
LPISRTPPPNGRWATGLWRVSAGVLSAGGALVSILSYTHSVTAYPDGSSRASRPHPTPHSVAVAPRADTVGAIGDSIQLAVTATDERGATLAGLAPAWTSTDEAVASVDHGGTVVARGEGSTTIVVSVGQLLAQSRITVQQVAAAIRLGDSVVRVAEGERAPLSARVVDVRGNPIARAAALWHTSDSTVASVDGSTEVVGMSPGATTLSATFGDLVSGLRVEVKAVPASVTVVAGEGQRAAAGRPLPAPVTAQIVSRSGRPVSGVAVSFRIDGSSGSCEPAVDTSDGRGVVQTIWMLGSTPGRQHLTIAVEGVSVSPVLSAEADPVRGNTRIAVASEGLSGLAAETLAAPVLIRVTDSTGIGLADLPVTWRAPDGGAVELLGNRTDSLGEARARVKLGPRAGPQRVQVQVGNPRTLPPYTFALGAQPGPAVRIVVESGDGQRGTVGSPLRRSLAVRTLDRLGNSVPAVPLAVLPAAGSVADSVLRTDSTGSARVLWTLGRTAGLQRLRVRLGDAPGGLDLTARASAGAPAAIAFVAPPATATAGRALARPVTVSVTDQYGNPALERGVSFRSSSGRVTPTRVVTDSKGRAEVRWTPGAKPGEESLVATVPGTAVRETLTLRVTPRKVTRPAP